MASKMKIKKGDYVVVISGKDKGKKGDVLAVRRGEHRVVVQGVNVVKRHTRPRPGHPGGIDEKEAPIHVSNVALTDPKDGNASKVGYKFIEGGRKVRFARRSGEIIDR
ncbi:MAG: 50S ribosomal protein L24 [Alphaproteobacteria bacterium]|nr:50S ribosomal protein L24 [Alphaproteobacteria bacterium]